MKVFSCFMSAVSILFCLTSASANEKAPLPISQDAVIAEAQVIAKAYAELNWFSGSILVARDGEPIYQSSFGSADLDAKTPNHQKTKYNLGSIMKHYTAVLVLQQVEKGTLNLDAKLEGFDLGFPSENASKITIRHLLDHRSGFADIFTAEYRENQLAFDTIAKRLELLKDAPLRFEPGSDYLYSNYGYVVLGAILQKITGENFASLLRENIFKRLELEESIYPYEADATNQSLRYTFNYAGEKVFVGVTEHHGPDGGIEATVSEVLTFYRALFYSDKLLSPQKDVIRAYFPIGKDYWSAFGGGAGVSTAVEFDLKNKFEIIVLANTDQLVAEEISGRIYSFINKGSYKPIVQPPHVYAWKCYKEMGREAFKSGFKARYEVDGYTQFIGRTLNELGMSLVQAKKWDEAFDILHALGELFTNAPQVYDSLAFVYWSKGDKEKAVETFKKALAKQPDFSSDYSSDNYGSRVE
jgi:CubicO group peptidase (beta-lactamase class C family)